MSSAYLDPFGGSHGTASEQGSQAPRADLGKTCGYLAKESQWRRGVSILDRPKILCVNSDALLLATIAEVLLDHDFQVLMASDGPSGIEMAKAEIPDLILLDIALSRMDGLEVCRRLRTEENLRQVPIIMMMPVDDPDLAVKGIQAGATRAFHKPFGSANLTDVIHATLVSTAVGRATGHWLHEDIAAEASSKPVAL